ncbi:sigma 54 modulation/S30EA ribosomal C-terminal domain-containing protein [Nocardia concava]|uniref:sigma 54 modulation/S30EA ribosomal C-terminal domain-containing protein n=1 Tax=Nocardia concava TaxID=257281 RepID=UPI001FDEDB9C|nr:sigma 54 modulation/S30EA ribosomal C-terminal domain-containing protein [Nocardia concava]
MTLQTAETRSVLRISTGHDVSADTTEYLREKVGRALEHLPGPLVSARVRLTRHSDRITAKPVIAQANVSLSGRTVRVQVAAASEREAADLLEARLKSRLERLARHWEAVRGGRPTDATPEWRHGATPRERLPYFPRAAEEREVVRRKSFALAAETCDEAAFDMELQDYEFQLFTEAGSGIDSVLYRRAHGALRLAQLAPLPDAVTRGAAEISFSPLPSPELDLPGAIERLELTHWPFVFFRDRDSGRGSILYHRYDGHYGLITPAA